MFEAISNNRMERIEQLLLKRANVNKINTEGETALTFAILQNKLDVAKLLLDCGARPNLENEKQISPLILAIKHDNIEAVKLLLEFGANSQQIYKEKSPLEISLQEKKYSIAKEILKYETFHDKDLKRLLSLANIFEDRKLTEITSVLDDHSLKICFAETINHVETHSR